ncbi:OmpA family protein [Mariniflexile litorale]|uniref:OmpA family protein n=1 Tax=Mariniflexile litorale TaxID=3045158 RepID=A0AAU7EJM5_9FLAO|nr:OmpA family protein [Mariniflexile sp. KMM 9835]MDQ8210927.1 OmpA family protein [Mariniflexile sp. KMM 9835]
MKPILSIFIFFISHVLFCQGASSAVSENDFAHEDITSKAKKPMGANGFKFKLLDAGVNSQYSEFGSGFFRNKLIMVSSKKLGGLASIDTNTNEAYKDLFCLDISSNGQLSLPLLFSRILNTNESEDLLAFSPDQKTVYFTRSSKENSLEYKLYKAVLEDDSHGNWINQELLNINKEGVSIETPFVSPDGKSLYFASNMDSSLGGFDIYVSEINTDGTLGTPENVGNTINTNLDEKYPSLSKDGKQLYFSSKGHENIGGYDLFVSKIISNGYKTPRNLGNTINSSYDEVAYFLDNKEGGYVSSNKLNSKGGFDIYTVINEEVIQTLEGTIFDLETKIKLPNTLVVLKDEEGNELARTLTQEDATYKFDVSAFESYQITTSKEGFKESDLDFYADRDYNTSYTKDIELLTTEPVITKVDEELRIVIENIYFDFAKYSIKEESHVSLNKIIKVLKEYPDIKLSINAHTDNIGKDAYNLNLSNKRAASTVKYLISKDITKDRLVSIGFGETKPLVDCKNNCTDEDLQTNRRVEFVILD